MKAPKYFISLGGMNLHRVTSFELNSDRDIDDYDGIGSGKFNVPDAHNPREWTIDCELLQDGRQLENQNSWSASEIFKQFETWLGKTDAPIRMVKTDQIYSAANLSVLVWLKSYKPKEADEQGVYDTEIVVVEYKPVGIKTTGIPSIARPGKVPIPPKVIITKKNTIYRVTKKYSGGSPTSNNKPRTIIYKSIPTGKPMPNPVTVKTYSAWNIGTKAGSIYAPKSNTYRTDTGNIIKETFWNIGEGIKKFFTGAY